MTAAVEAGARDEPDATRAHRARRRVRRAEAVMQDYVKRLSTEGAREDPHEVLSHCR
jgi:hypothetical protein